MGARPLTKPSNSSALIYQAALARVDAALAEPATPLPAPAPGAPTSPQRGLAWGAKVSAVFRERVRWIETWASIPTTLMACMAWESGRSFRADIKNIAGVGRDRPDPVHALDCPRHGNDRGRAGPPDARGSAQLGLEICPDPTRAGSVRPTSTWPSSGPRQSASRRASRAVHGRRARYRQNAGLDASKDGKVTKREAAAKVMGLLDEGCNGNVA